LKATQSIGIGTNIHILLVVNGESIVFQMSISYSYNHHMQQASLCAKMNHLISSGGEESIDKSAFYKENITSER